MEGDIPGVLKEFFLVFFFGVSNKQLIHEFFFSSSSHFISSNSL
jgi:hypothetical protein